ncbi:hypothetical protein RGUI_1574 [Rhodovulum sp. P5]|nr:hypothetical protein RGUI_1574 [Rhodovulum sp. P5]
MSDPHQRVPDPDHTGAVRRVRHQRTSAPVAAMPRCATFQCFMPVSF